MPRLLLLLILSCLLPLPALAAQTPPWEVQLGALPIQDGGRVMPLDTYARNLAVQLTGRSSWGAGKGPEAFSGKTPVELIMDLTFRGPETIHKPLIIIESASFKKAAGLDANTRFFSPIQLGQNQNIETMLRDHMAAKQANPDARPTKEQSIAMEIRDDLERVGMLVENPQFAIIPAGANKAFRKTGPRSGDVGAENVTKALAALGQAYLLGQGEESAVQALKAEIQAVGTLDPKTAKNVDLELKYNIYRPWQTTAIFYALALIVFGVSRLTLRKPLIILGSVLTAIGVLIHSVGIGLRVVILERAPVSNTYEALLWMGVFAIGVALVAQLINRKAWYFVAGVTVALLSVLFANLVPLDSQTNSLPAVLRSNYWLIIHVITITSSYGVLAVASILGHVYLFKDVLFTRKAQDESRLSHPIIVQVYRCMQLGLVLLTAGTILGGVWAADSWGRFWGWDPKETWALISIVVYFIILHARYLRWIRDFGMAVWGVLAFACIVWTFYGVNYLMASGLHSYGFGQGGGTWVAIYAIGEILFVSLCWLKYRGMRARAAGERPAAVNAAKPTDSGLSTPKASPQGA